MIKSEDMVVEVTGPKNKVAVDFLLILNSFLLPMYLVKKKF